MNYYNNDEREAIFEIADESILSILNGDKSWKPAVPELPKLLEERAVFVTLKIDGDLRGCIGEMVASKPLYLAVAEMARSAAFKDPRFRPLSKIEYEEIDIEISVLTPMQKINSYLDIELGVDGVWIRKGARSGVFLPQVATETGWDLDTFLRNLCTHKAGLPQDAYKDPTVEIYKYQVEIL
ncbi:MAG: AmmeMemoRadiSam system protein A [Fibrobacteres bacterium]|nr:AmmeMemoRadiSam system protein A [Fibrobacterota bacterium]